jgi:hypothetical protein
MDKSTIRSRKFFAKGLAFLLLPSIMWGMQRTIGYFWRFYFTLASEGPLIARR